MSPLLFLILLPVFSAIFCFLAPYSARKTAILGAALNFVLLLGLLYFFQTRTENAGQFFFLMEVPILPDWGLHFTLGADGFSMVMLLLSTLVSLAAVWTSPVPEKSPGLFYGSVLLISAGVVGAFSSVDVFFFYIFHELALIPTFLLIGIWGSGDRQRVAWKATIYLALGSFVLLIGILGLYLSAPDVSRSFDMRTLVALARSGAMQPPLWVFFALLFGFGTLVSLFPFHTWAPAAYASAPAPAAMLHAGVLKKFGLYGLLRIVTPIFPSYLEQFANLILALIIGNILYVGYVTVSQKRLDWMAGYSSVMHMGYIFLGFAGAFVTFPIDGVMQPVLNPISAAGAGLLMFGHGVSIAAMFALIGHIRQRTGTLEFSELGGLGRVLPSLGLLFGFATMASIGLPGFANFPGELMVFFGAFGSGGSQFLNFHQITTIVAVWGVVISALYGLRAYRAAFFGEMPDRWKSLVDIPLSTRLGVILLIAISMIVGFYPQLLIHLITPALIAQ